MRRRGRRSSLAALALCLVLAGCAEYTVVATTPPPTANTLVLPPIGFNHRFGNNPLASRDGFAIERTLYAQRVFWEVAIRTDPVQAGYVSLGSRTATTRARHAVRSVLIVIATEDRFTIIGLLAWPGHAGQAQYCEALLSTLRAMGYDAFTMAQVLVYFTESDEHAQLLWTKKGGYTYSVYDDDLKGTGLTPAPQTTPIPTPPPIQVAP